MSEKQTEDISRRVQLAYLADFYGGLLTQRQREVLALHCNEDMSLSEIAQELGTSRQAVHEQFTRAESRLNELEEHLHQAERALRTEEKLSECLYLLEEGKSAEAQALLRGLIEE